MTKFERIGCNIQYTCRNEEEATTALNWSCECCTHSTRATYCRCDRCAIQQVHNQLMAAFADQKAKEEQK